MPRLSRIVIPGAPHHVVQRGNNRQDVFFVEEDYEAYLSELRRQAEAYGLGIYGYCLMTNHIHLIVRPDREDSLAKAVGRTHFRYSQYINRMHGRSGHLWQGRFHSCALDEEHFWAALRYVERNPVRAGLVKWAWKYDRSSALAHVSGDDEPGLLDMAWWAGSTTGQAWRGELRRRLKKEQATRLRTTTQRGWPLAGDAAAAKFEKLLGRRVRPLPLGRPKGAKDKRKRTRRGKSGGKKKR